MIRGGNLPLEFSTSLGRHCLTTLTKTIDWCGAALDPRPDLAVPARRIRTPFLWWW